EAAREAVGHVGERVELGARQTPERDLDPEHLEAVLPLAVHAAEQAEGPERVRPYLGALETFESLDEVVDVAWIAEARQLGHGLLRGVRSPVVGHAHPRCRA